MTSLTQVQGDADGGGFGSLEQQQQQQPAQHQQSLHSRVRSVDTSRRAGRADVESLRPFGLGGTAGAGEGSSSTSSSGNYKALESDKPRRRFRFLSDLRLNLSLAGSFFRREAFPKKKTYTSILTRERYHALPIKDLSPSRGGSPGSTLREEGALWSGGAHRKEDRAPSKRKVGANLGTMMLVLIIVMVGWTLFSLLTIPVPLISSVPHQVIEMSININQHIEARIKEEQDLLRQVNPIQLPWANLTSPPQVNSFADLVRAEDVCPHAAAAVANATAFERQFGAHEFQHVNTELDGKERRRVALFTGAYSNIRDGVSLTLNKMVAFLQENGHEVLIFAPTNHEPALDQAVGKILSVPSIPVPGRPEYRLSLILSFYLQRQLKDFKPDIVHIATPDIVGFEALIWAKLNGIPTACSYHTRFNSYLEYYHVGLLEPASWLIWGQFYGHCDHVYVPSKEIKEELEQHGIDKDVRIWARGVDPEVFSPDFRCPAWRQAVGVGGGEDGGGGGEPVLLLVCRMVWEKNLELFARTVERLQSLGVAFKSVVVGEGPARDALQERLPATSFLGNLKGEDLSTAFANADVFLFPSTTETFGSTTLEAMSSGVPVVVSNASGSNSLVSQGLNGFIADPEDVESFVDFTSKLMQDPALRKEMGSAGRRRAMTEFQYSKIFGDLIHHYSDLLLEYAPDQGGANQP